MNLERDSAPLRARGKNAYGLPLTEDLLNLVVEIKGYRREDAKMKKLAMNTYWISGVNQLQTYGR
ncbi:MAG: hypothetical protein ACREU2_08405, partial [Steroidobacteraceae bacterium]